MASVSGTGRPIIVVPASDIPGNISLKNAPQFLGEGKYLDATKVA